MPLIGDSYDPQLLRKCQSLVTTAEVSQKLTIVNCAWKVGQDGDCSESGGVQDPCFVIIGYIGVNDED